jgi:hypothetical protein
MADLKSLPLEELAAKRAQLDAALRGMALMGGAPDKAGLEELRAVEAELARRGAPEARPKDDPFGVADRLK